MHSLCTLVLCTRIHEAAALTLEKSALAAEHQKESEDRASERSREQKLIASMQLELQVVSGIAYKYADLKVL